MAPNAEQIQVPMDGTLYTCTWSSALTFPTTVRGTLGASSWAELGYTSEDGATFGSTPNVEDVNAWQSADPVRRLVTSRINTVATSLLQWNKTTVQDAFGGGSWSNDGTTYTYTPPAPQDPLANLGLILDGEDGTRKFRWLFYKTNVTDAVETSMTRTAPAMLPVTFSTVKDSGYTTTWKFMSDDSSAFA